MPIPNLTFVVFTRNEEDRLPFVIRNLQDFGPILVVDNESVDQTQIIAKQYGCRLLVRKATGFNEDVSTLNDVFAAVDSDWIYRCDADEIIDADVLRDIERVVRGGKHDIIRIMRKNYLYGEFCNDVWADYHTKAYKKTAIDFTGNKIHQFGVPVVPENRIYQMPSNLFVHHLVSNTVDAYLHTFLRYSTMDAEQNEGPAFNPKRLMLLPIRLILKQILFRGAWKAGLAGSYMAAHQILYSLLVYMKTHEPRELRTTDAIIRKNSEIAASILDRFAPPLNPKTPAAPAAKGDNVR